MPQCLEIPFSFNGNFKRESPSSWREVLLISESLVTQIAVVEVQSHCHSLYILFPKGCLFYMREDSEDGRLYWGM